MIRRKGNAFFGRGYVVKVRSRTEIGYRDRDVAVTVGAEMLTSGHGYALFPDDVRPTFWSRTRVITPELRDRIVSRIADAFRSAGQPLEVC